jgi:hypothetical protein
MRFAFPDTMVSRLMTALSDVRAGGREVKAVYLGKEEDQRLVSELIGNSTSMLTWKDGPLGADGEPVLPPPPPEVDYPNDGRRGTFMGVPWFVEGDGLVVEAE